MVFGGNVTVVYDSSIWQQICKDDWVGYLGSNLLSKLKVKERRVTSTVPTTSL